MFSNVFDWNMVEQDAIHAHLCNGTPELGYGSIAELDVFEAQHGRSRRVSALHISKS